MCVCSNCCVGHLLMLDISVLVKTDKKLYGVGDNYNTDYQDYNTDYQDSVQPRVVKGPI